MYIINHLEKLMHKADGVLASNNNN